MHHTKYRDWEIGDLPRILSDDSVKSIVLTLKSNVTGEVYLEQEIDTRPRGWCAVDIIATLIEVRLITDDIEETEEQVTLSARLVRVDDN